MSAAGLALTILPPRVPRFWMARAPVARALFTRLGEVAMEGRAIQHFAEGRQGAEMHPRVVLGDAAQGLNPG